MAGAGKKCHSTQQQCKCRNPAAMSARENLAFFHNVPPQRQSVARMAKTEIFKIFATWLAIQERLQ
jgi:hypothetical protein